MNWEPKTREDRLLEVYWQCMGGDLYLEVPIGGSSEIDVWSGSSVRRVDGVILNCAEPGRARRFRRDDLTEFVVAARQRSLHLIEVKHSLNRGVIGQAIVARRLFEHQYGAAVARVSIVCARGDAALQWVCSHERIEVIVSTESFGKAES